MLAQEDTRFYVHSGIDWIGTGIHRCCAPTGFIVNSSAGAGWLFTARSRIGGYAVNN